MLHYFRAGAPSRREPTPEYDDYAGWIAMAQHWGLPTRLLDWTSAAIIGLYFATTRMPNRQQDTDVDGVVWALEPFAMNEQLKHHHILHSMRGRLVRPYVREAFMNVHSPIYPQWEQDRSFMAESPYIAVLAAEHEPRIRAQQGAFTIHTNQVPLNKFPGADNWLVRAVIPSASINKVRLEVQTLGVSKSQVYPDLAALTNDIAERHGIT